MKNEKKLPPYAIESVSNALRLLTLLREKGSLRVIDGSKELDVARSTAHRLLATLAHEGYVQQARNSREYEPGPALMELGFTSAGFRELRDVARPIMERLCSERQETVHIAVWERHNIRFLESVECQRPLRVAGRRGELLPSFASAAGRIFLAEVSDDELDEILSRRPAQLTSSTLSDKTSIQERLADIRRTGYALNIEETLEGLHAVATPLRGANGELVAALTISAPSSRGGLTRLREHAKHLCDASSEIGALLAAR